jgi:hypothetical protein
MAEPCLIELNDAEIRASQGARLILRAPGIAVVERGTLHLGEAAARRAHLHPRQTWNRFWSALGQDPWPAPVDALRHNADLAWHQLRFLHERAGKPAEVVFAVPGSFSAAQLALLLGIAQSCPFRAAGLVDAAVAAVAACAGPGRYQHLDLQLHQAVLTRIDVTDEVTRHSVDVIEGTGVLAFHDAAAELAADTFIQQSRFDPLHRAETEQALYDQLPRCLAAFAAQSEVMLELSAGHTRQKARVTRDAMNERLQRVADGIVQRLEPGRAVLLGDRAAAIPGLSAACGALLSLPEDAVRNGVARHGERVRSPGPNLGFVTRLPAPADPLLRLPETAPAEAAPAATGRFETPTHLLHGHHAWPLGQRTLYLSARGSVSVTPQPISTCSVSGNGAEARIQPLSDISIYVDGERVAGPRRLGAGDKISFAGSDTVYSLIATVRADVP